MDIEEFRRFGHAVIDWVADYRGQTRLGELPVMARVAPGGVKRELPVGPPPQPEPFEAVLQDLTRIILPACTHSQDPRFFGYFPSVSSLAAVLGDYVATGLAQLGINWQASPALTELEDVTISWLRQMLGLSAAWSGAFQDTATTGTLVALLSARERATSYGASRGGLQESARPLVVYASSQSHESVGKAVRLAGIGSNNLRLVPVDDRYAMRTDVLEEMIRTDRARGLQPCAVVATTGSAETTALDPVADIAAITCAQGLWLHVDAAMAGSAMILPECRWMWAGVEKADSIVFNPHKWLGASFDCSVYWVRDAEHLLRVMSANSSYLHTRSDSRVKSYRDWGIPLSRPHRAVKVWFLVREQGVSGLQARIRRDIGHAQWLAEQVDATSGWRRMAPSPLQTVCVRHEPPGLNESALDTHTLAWVCRINESGRAYLTPARLDGRWMVRIAFGSEATEHHHVAALWSLMRDEASWHH
jgi:aromatic-L-amino-acid decarboxylase